MATTTNVYVIVSDKNEMLLLSNHVFTDGGNAITYARETGLKNYAVAQRLLLSSYKV